MSIAANYRRILESIKETALTAGRQPDEVTLIAVSKYYSVEKIQEVYAAGCNQFGENRLQEALPKMKELPEDIHWHLIGTLQKNKVNKAVGRFELIHSVDSLELAHKISEVSLKQGEETRILLQVNTSGEASKHGFDPQVFEEVLGALAGLPNVSLGGLMTMAPLEASENDIHVYFARLRALRDKYRPLLIDRHDFKHLSMGMSHDYKIAIQEGATLLRIGTSIFGNDH